MLNRRDFIRRLVGGGVGIALAPALLLAPNPTTLTGPVTVAPFVYSDDFLERYIVPAMKVLADHVDQTLLRTYRQFDTGGS